MGKQIIDLIGEIVEISGNATVDSAIFFVIGIISFSVAFGLVGKIFDVLGFYDSDIMSEVHWLIRVGIFGGLTFLCVKIAQIITWLFIFKWWLYVIGIVIILATIILVYWLRYKYQSQKYKSIIKNEQQDFYNYHETNKKEKTVTNDRNILTENIYDKYHCPRCNAKLVKRHGPYGDFYGCEAYRQTGCRYTRKYL